jgi:uncharacterized protein (TIGR00255 family)
MTGFGRAEAEQDGRKVTLELKTVNHRFLDLNIRIPRALGFAEEAVRKGIKEKLSRGHVDVFVSYNAVSADAKTAKADVGLMRSYLHAAQQAAKEAGVTDDLALSHLIRIPDVIMIEEAPEDENRLKHIVEDALALALESLNDMRLREGEELKANLLACLEELEAVLSTVDGRKGLVPAEYAEKLRQRLSELIKGTDIDDARFTTEIALMADRSDICEETVRLATHINQFRKAVSEEGAVGRKLDFMVQEMNRELNTIGSKSGDMTITNAVIAGKSVVEKIREQVQNIE